MPATKEVEATVVEEEKYGHIEQQLYYKGKLVLIRTIQKPRKVWRHNGKRLGTPEQGK